MKKVRIPLALAAALIAGVAVVGTASSSARFATFTFVKKAQAPAQSTAKADYVFKTNSGTCRLQPNEICKAVWSQTTQPLDGQSPSVTSVITSDRIVGETNLILP